MPTLDEIRDIDNITAQLPLETPELPLEMPDEAEHEGAEDSLAQEHVAGAEDSPARQDTPE